MSTKVKNTEGEREEGGELLRRVKQLEQRLAELEAQVQALAPASHPETPGDPYTHKHG
jgi:hypothetical protein